MSEREDDISQYIIDVSDYNKILPSFGSGTYGNIATFCHKNSQIAEFAGKEYDMNNEKALTSFLREIYILTSDYPTILQLKGWSVIDKVIVMLDLMQKGSLYNIIHENDPELTPTNKQIILYGISKGMDFLHSKNIINRDLNPSNILLDDNLHPKIIDFNFSKFTSNILDTNQSQSYPMNVHRAPEMNKNNYNAKVDVYSFGVIFYELIIDRILQRRQEINFQDEKVPPNFKHQIEECLTDDFEKRPSFKEISEFLRTNFLPDVDEDEFQKYVKELDNVKPKETLIEMSKEDDLYDHFYQLGSSLKDGQNKDDLFRAANLFKVAAGLCLMKSKKTSDDKVQQVSENASEEYKEALKKLERKDEEMVLSMKLYNQKQEQQENPNNQSLVSDDDQGVYSIIPNIFRFHPLDQEAKAIFYVNKVDFEKNKLYVFDRDFNYSYLIQIIGDLPEDQKKILRIHSLIVSEKLKVPTQRNKLSFQVKINDDDPPDIPYFRYPKIDEIYQFGIITDFLTIQSKKLYKCYLNIIAAVNKDSYKENDSDNTYISVKIIDAFYQNMTATFFSPIKETLKDIIENPNFKPSTPILFQNVEFSHMCGIISMNSTESTYIHEIENDQLSKIYEESFTEARKGKPYSRVYVKPQFSTIDGIKQPPNKNEGKTYEVIGRINSIELNEKSIEYVHLDQNIYDKKLVKYDKFDDSEGKYHYVDKGESGDQSLEMIPIFTLSVEIADSVKSDSKKEAITSVPEVVNYLLGRPVDDTSLSLFAQYGPKKEFRKNIEKYISENKKLNLTLRMILRIYNWGDINKYAIRIEKIIENEDEMQKANQLRTECKKEKDLEKKKELFKKSFNIFLNEVKIFNSFEAKYQCALMSFKNEELVYLDKDNDGILNIKKIWKILKYAADNNYKHDSALQYFEFLNKNELDDHNKWEYMRMAAEKGCDKETQYKYGEYLYNQGRTDEGLKYIKKADENGYTKASIFLNQRIDKERNSKISPKD
ncbi:hypothetical protein M9Y10_006759 [Tritrichomonas musculus]|uniref:Protein kinase domain-containing protein n=1 Tax=Tritrichomonas musculus TaxID=1915356 RepID=A0ABR2JFY5_9EUKA